MNLFEEDVKSKVERLIIEPLKENDYTNISNHVMIIYNELHARIPNKKRISYGAYYVVRILGEYLYERFMKNNLQVLNISEEILRYDKPRTSGVALCVVSCFGIDNLVKVLPYFEKYAADNDWEVREFAAGFIHKLVKKYPDELHRFYSRLVKSSDPKVRRFVSESLRPVSENRWLYKDPEYSLSIINYLYKEKSAYPRTSVGNHLSDFARKLPDLVYEIVEELVRSGDKNSYWIAYRACRNLVKKEPLKVMDLLQVDEYRYKTRVHKRDDY